MDDKKAREAFRVQQFSHPHPALQVADAQKDSLATTPVVQPSAATSAAAAAAASADAGDPLNINLVPDHERVIIHFDVDCFYAQVEECRNPALRGKPLAVTQKYLVVTANYPAREAGVTKLMGIADAKKACPQLLLVPGEDLTPYRAASRAIRAVLSRWGPTEKLGLDESWVDVTQEVDRRLAAAAAANTTAAIASSPWSGHLVSSGLQLTSHSRHRPMDLRVVRQHEQPHEHEHGSDQLQEQEQEQHQEQRSEQHPQYQQHQQRQQAAAVGSDVAGTQQGLLGEVGSDPAAAGEEGGRPPWLPGCELRLKLGAVVAAEMRTAVKAEAGFRCSAGVSCSKLLSKLVSGLHKPDDQTIILPTQAQAFVAPLPVRALPGVGYKADGLLKSWGVSTAAEARAISKQQLVQALGDKQGTGLFHACRGVDPSPVVASGPPKSITVEDSFKACSTWQGVAQVLQVLVPDLLDRLLEDTEEFPQLLRTPSTLTVKWRKAGTGWARSSASTPWPAAAKASTYTSSSSNSAQGTGHSQHPASTGSGYAAVAGRQAAVSAVTAAATSLLKQHLPASGFSLTLLNVGAGFKSKAIAGVGSSIQQFFAPKQTPSRSAAAALDGAAVGAAAAGGPSPPPPPAAAAAVAAAAGGGVQGMALLQQARAATEARRDYNRAAGGSSSALPPQQRMSCLPPNHGPVATGPMSSPVQAWGGQQGMLTKRQERQLWELAMHQQQQQQEGPTVQTYAAGNPAAQQQQHQQQQQQHQQQQHQHQRQRQQQQHQQLQQHQQHQHQQQQQHQQPQQHQQQHQQQQQAMGFASCQAVEGALPVQSTPAPVAHSTPSAAYASQLLQQHPPGSTPHTPGPTANHHDGAQSNEPLQKRQRLCSERSSPDTAAAAAAGVLGEGGTDPAAAAAAGGVATVYGDDSTQHAGTSAGGAAAAAAVSSFDGGAAAAAWAVGGSWCCTTLHSVDGLGVLACEVIEEFEGDSE